MLGPVTPTAEVLSSFGAILSVDTKYTETLRFKKREGRGIWSLGSNRTPWASLIDRGKGSAIAGIFPDSQQCRARLWTGRVKPSEIVMVGIQAAFAMARL